MQSSFDFYDYDILRYLMMNRLHDTWLLITGYVKSEKGGKNILGAITLRFLLYVLVLLYVLFQIFWLIFTYTYRTIAFLNFLIGEKLKIWKFSFSFQIYVHYDLKNQFWNIYKYRIYNRNLRIFQQV